MVRKETKSERTIGDDGVIDKRGEEIEAYVRFPSSVVNIVRGEKEVGYGLPSCGSATRTTRFRLELRCKSSNLNHDSANILRSECRCHTS